MRALALGLVEFKMNQGSWTMGKKGYLYPLPKTSRCTLWGPDYPAQVRAGLSGLGKLRPRLGISSRKSVPSLSVAPSLPLINFWGPDYPALCEGRIIRPGEKNRPSSDFPGENPT